MKLLSTLQSEKVGGRDRVRTCDPLLAKQVLSQLSYTPTSGTVNDFKVFATVRKLRKLHFSLYCVRFALNLSGKWSRITPPRAFSRRAPAEN